MFQKIHYKLKKAAFNDSYILLIKMRVFFAQHTHTLNTNDALWCTLDTRLH